MLALVVGSFCMAPVIPIEVIFLIVTSSYFIVILRVATLMLEIRGKDKSNFSLGIWFATACRGLNNPDSPSPSAHLFLSKTDMNFQLMEGVCQGRNIFSLLIIKFTIIQENGDIPLPLIYDLPM